MKDDTIMLFKQTTKETSNVCSLQEPCFRNIHAMMTKKAKSGGMAATSETQAKDLVIVSNS